MAVKRQTAEAPSAPDGFLNDSSTANNPPQEDPPRPVLEIAPEPVTLTALALRAPDVKAELVMSFDEARARLQELRRFVAEVMVEDEDFGKIPGAGDRLVLLQPGAQKLLELYGYFAEVQIEKETEEWGEQDTGGGWIAYPFFYYRVRATAVSKRTGNPVGVAYGSCNSREKKYLWRGGELKCPACGKANIRKSKNPKPGQFWYCWAKTGGCGGNFGERDPQITSQVVGQVRNPEPYDLVNTIQKMAVKRAVVAAAIAVTRSAMLFTQDLEPADDSTDYPDLQEQKERAHAPGTIMVEGEVVDAKTGEVLGKQGASPPVASYKSETESQPPTIGQLKRLRAIVDKAGFEFKKEGNEVWVDFPPAVFTVAWRRPAPEVRLVCVYDGGKPAQVTAFDLEEALIFLESATPEHLKEGVPF